LSKLLYALAAAAVCASVLVLPAGAITGNSSDDFNHDYVALLVFYKPSPAQGEDTFLHRCSGTLLADGRTIVTAGHCAAGANDGRAYFQQSVAPNYDPNAFGGLGGDETTGYPYRGGITFHKVANYGFDDFASFPDTHDAGVVVLDQKYTPPSKTYGKLPTAGQVDAYAQKNKKNSWFELSGYGLSDQDPVPVSFRKRLTAVSYLVNDTAPVTEFNLKTTANPSQGKGGTCNGDSGGPVFFGGTNVIAAVTSYGDNAQCKGLDFGYRLDRAPVLSWVNDPNRPDAG
jgi:hypothetical protein